MKLFDFSKEQWQMKQGNKAFPCHIPAGIVSVLTEHGQMEDPYWRDNEKKAAKLLEKDYVFECVFTVEKEMLRHERVVLCCEGLDTLAEVELNGTSVGKADNMHRTWRFDVGGELQEGENLLRISFKSASRYVKEHAPRIGKPYSAIRKAACMFGWDWGIDLPDGGIWKDIYLEGFDVGRICGMIISQEHHAAKGDGTKEYGSGIVAIRAEADCEVWSENVSVQMELCAPDGTVLAEKCVPARLGEDAVSVEFRITAPQLWWPVGYGSQPLYTLTARLKKENIVYGQKQKRIGLRTIVLDRTPVGGGSRYSVVVNGIPVFFRGENLIIQDAVLGRTKEENWRRLIQNCLESNLNGIRVWGGACYPQELFYDLCDEKGLLVYQDLMFACSFYELSGFFVETVMAELKDNLERIGSHACLALLCGNNEVDAQYTVGGSKDPETADLRKLFTGKKEPLPESVRQILWSQYEPLFLQMIPEQCARYAPDTSYVPSSPSIRKPGGAESFFDYLSDGDMHYYLQYNGNAPYQKVRALRCRFMTEIGFQSYPSVKTIREFTEPQDRRPYTPVMYAHQKCANGNEAIETYMGREYAVPERFEDYVYLSQLQAGEIMKYTAEHFRRDNEYCRGMILWQLNDCWPVVSWSGIDYYGRWKALQYYTKRFFSPVLASAWDEGTTVSLWLSNETPEHCRGLLRWQLCDGQDRTVREGRQEAEISSGKSREVLRLTFEEQVTEETKHEMYFRYWFENPENSQSGSVLFVPAKEFCFSKPVLYWNVEEEETEFKIRVAGSCFAKGVALETTEGTCIFSDNFFDLSAGEEREILVKKEYCREIEHAEELKKQLQVLTLNEVMLRSGKGAD